MRVARFGAQTTAVLQFDVAAASTLACGRSAAPLSIGGALVHRAADEALDAAAICWRMLREQQRDVMHADAVGAARRCASRRGRRSRALRRVIVGGEALDARDAGASAASARGRELLQPVRADGDDGRASTLRAAQSTRERGSVPIGRPIANTRIYVLDAHGEPVPVGRGGRAVHRRRGRGARLSEPAGADGGAVRGRSVQRASRARGCTGRATWARWLPDGNLEFLGRNDYQVKIRGFRIELARSRRGWREHAGVREAVVVAREDGAGRQAAGGVCTRARARSSAPEALRAHAGGERCRSTWCRRRTCGWRRCR